MTDAVALKQDERTLPVDVLVGTNVSAFSYDSENRLSWAENLPGNLSEDAFATLLEDCVIDAVSRQTVATAARWVARCGEPFSGHFELVTDNVVRQYDLSLRRNAGGRVVGIAIDVTGRERGESAVRALSLELAHRTKNLMAVVMSLATQTANRAKDMPEFKKRFFGQVTALSRAHDSIAKTGWHGASVSEIIAAQITSIFPDAHLTFKAQADSLTLTPNAAQHLAMVLHELVASCGPSGQMSLEIFPDSDGGLAFECRLSQIEDRARLWDALLVKVAPLAMSGAGEIVDAETSLNYTLMIGSDQLVGHAH